MQGEFFPPVAPPPLTREQRFIYAAGLFDGEGYVGLEFSKRPRATVLLLVVQVQMSTPQGPALFAELFGGRVRIQQRRSLNVTGKPYRPMYFWRLCAAKAIPVLVALRPYLREKAAQVDLCLEARRIQQNRPQGQGAFYRREDRARVGEIHAQVRALKRT